MRCNLCHERGMMLPPILDTVRSREDKLIGFLGDYL
jgi:hypothetical protein